MKPQVTKDAYDFDRYVYPERWASYYEQLRLALPTRPETVLVVGPGDGIVPVALAKYGNCRVTTVDIAEDVEPDVVASVDALPFDDKSFDLALCCEVLEHVPFERFDTCLTELARVARRVIVSLPHFGPEISLDAKLPFLPRVQAYVKVPYPREHAFNGEHYWEIGKRGYSRARIRTALERHFTIVEERAPKTATYHRFYDLAPRA